ncbi:MAG: SGNH/GDSL hydrolase family protein [Lachnospiraceae bacterium]|nr:SGNH/GDSL hydrolase family protein [Lachnospiraceae bacterium]
MTNESKGKLIPVIAGVLISALLIAVSVIILNAGKRSRQGYDVVIFGDSLVANAQDETSVAAMLSEKTGLSVGDFSFGGTMMAYNASNGSIGSSGNFLCMASISRALLTDDFSVQINAHVSDPATEFFPERIEELTHLSLKDSDIVIIEHCINDYHCAIPIGDATSDSEYTYCGALKLSVEYIRRINPDIRIILVSPTEKWMPDGVNASDYSYGGGILDEYVDAQRMMAEELGLEYLSMYELYDNEISVFGDEVTEEPVTGFKYTVDGTHPNYYGRYVISDLLADYLSGAFTGDDDK